MRRVYDGFCEESWSWEAVVIQDGRVVGYGQGTTRAEAIEAALADAEGRRLPPRQPTLMERVMDWLTEMARRWA
ncbi:hypothetical protein KQ693_05785 [Thermus sp. PS18]|uniref:hypothetical protein n=1 Tax=Thermus sp. PS18 TaxID=2849039 RepID=UPI0022653845|nr:hypothetical protein [Thermus sp. PS18]UZX16540.1 hypothetical protein KQ693_05785 [Thermus sp. PS18]